MSGKPRRALPLWLRVAGGLALAASMLPLQAAAGADALATHLSEVIQIPTVYPRAGGEQADTAFARLDGWLTEAFPALERHRVPVGGIGHSRLYRWAGTDDSLQPVILLAHWDVVPVVPGTGSEWTHPPFSGAIADGYIWGRGALDDKSNALAHLEAINRLMAAGFKPRRTVWIAHGHDEEVDGSVGAQGMAAYLEQQGVRAWFTLDEGSAVAQGLVDGVEAPIAFIMAGEKGYLSLRLTARAQGGHSSTPPEKTAIWTLARALAKLSDNPMPARIIPPVGRMLDDLAPHMPWLARLAIEQRWLFEPLLLKQLLASPTIGATVHTTMAPTMLMAGVKDNVLPSQASAVLNFRLLPGDDADDVVAHVRQVIADDSVEIRFEPGFQAEAPPLSDIDSDAMQAITQVAAQVFPDALTSTGIIMATTDNRHYARVRENGYYFSPYPYTADDQGRVHGADERIGIQDYHRMIGFYVELLRHVAQ